MYTYELLNSIIMKKYRLLEDDVINREGVTLHRIVALRDIINLNGDIIAKKGDKGGYIESEENLDQGDGSAWITKDAIVYCKAQVLENAQVRDHTVVHDYAIIKGDAMVGDYAEIFGKAVLGGYCLVSGYAKIHEEANVCFGAIVTGHTEIFGKAVIEGQVMEHAKVGGNTYVPFGEVVAGDVEL